jgi:hypothetical protein
VVVSLQVELGPNPEAAGLETTIGEEGGESASIFVADNFEEEKIGRTPRLYILLGLSFFGQQWLTQAPRIW